MTRRIRSHLSILCASLVFIGTAVSIGTFATGGIAGADTETHSGTQWNETGWQHEPFWTCDNACPVWSYASYIGGISWQSWVSSPAGIDYDKMTQDFWKGLLGSENNSGDPSSHDDAWIYVAAYGSEHLNGGTQISRNVGDGTCPQVATPAYMPCEESQFNGNGYEFTNPIDNGYINYASNYGYPPEYVNGAQGLSVLSGYIS